MRPILTTCLSGIVASLSVASIHAEELPIISRLVVREGTVLISADREGRLKYSLIDRNGSQTETNLSQVQLARKYPDLSDRLEPAVAENGQIPYSGILFFDR